MTCNSEPKTCEIIVSLNNTKPGTYICCCSEISAKEFDSFFGVSNDEDDLSVSALIAIILTPIRNFLYHLFLSAWNNRNDNLFCFI